jgi:hypothetical protein
LVLPAGLAARWLVPTSAAPEWMRLDGIGVPACEEPACRYPALRPAARWMVVIVAAAILLAGAGHQAGTSTMEQLVKGVLAPVALVLRPDKPGLLLQSMWQSVNPLFDDVAKRVWYAFSPLLGFTAAFAFLGVPVFKTSRPRSK